MSPSPTTYRSALAALSLTGLTFLEGCSKTPPISDTERWHGYQRSIQRKVVPGQIIADILAAQHDYAEKVSKNPQLFERDINLSRHYDVTMLSHAMMAGNSFLNAVAKIGPAVAAYQSQHKAQGANVYQRAHSFTRQILDEKSGSPVIAGLLRQQFGEGGGSPCVRAACVLTASLMNLLPSSELGSSSEVTVGIVTGLYHGSDVPQGAGHAWVRVVKDGAKSSDDQIFLDSSGLLEHPISFQGNSTTHIPFASTSFTVYPKTRKIGDKSQQILLIPPELR